MGSLTQDKAKIAGTGETPPEASAASTSPAAAQDNQKSWGDKYKHGTLHFVRNILVNYIINFGISAAGTYAVLKSPLNKYFENVAKMAVKQGDKINMPAKLSEGIANFFTSTQLLLCGGHILLPFMKYTHDNRNKLEFGIGNRLDKLQEALGRGNAASKRNIAEHKYIADLMAAKETNLSEDDKKLLARNNIGDNLQFTEHRESWIHLLKARATGVSLTTSMSILFGLSGNFPEKLQMRTIQQKAGKILSDKALGKIPRKLIADPDKLGEYAFLELLYTAASKLGFDHMEKRQLRNSEQQETDAAYASLKQDKEALSLGKDGTGSSVMSRTPSLPQGRQDILARGALDFSAREAAKPVGASMALS